MSDSKSGHSISGPPKTISIADRKQWTPKGKLVVATKNEAVVQQQILVSSGICTEMCMSIAQFVLVDSDKIEKATERTTKKTNALTSTAISVENKRMTTQDLLRDFSLTMVTEAQLDPTSKATFHGQIEKMQIASALGAGSDMITLLMVPEHTVMLASRHPDFFLFDPNFGLYKYTQESAALEDARGCYYSYHLMLGGGGTKAAPFSAFTVGMGFG